mgnify:CR=1 FL=1
MGMVGDDIVGALSVEGERRVAFPTSYADAAAVGSDLGTFLKG